MMDGHRHALDASACMQVASRSPAPLKIEWGRRKALCQCRRRSNRDIFVWKNEKNSSSAFGPEHKTCLPKRCDLNIRSLKSLTNRAPGSFGTPLPPHLAKVLLARSHFSLLRSMSAESQPNNLVDDTLTTAQTRFTTERADLLPFLKELWASESVSLSLG